MSSKNWRVDVIVAGALLSWTAAACGSPKDQELYSSAASGSAKGGSSDAAAGSSTEAGGTAAGGTAAGGSGSSDGGGAGGSSIAKAGAGGRMDETPPGPDVDLVDDMEDGDSAILSTRGRHGFWYSFTDGSAGWMNPNPMNSFYTSSLSPSRPDSDSTTGVYVQGGNFTLWGAAVAFDFSHPDGSDKRPYDVSSASGLRFYARADNPVSLNVQFPTIDSDPLGGRCTEGGGDDACFSHFGKVVELGPEWEEYTVLWSELQLPDFGLQVETFPAEQVYGLYFTVAADVQFGIWLDDVALVN